MNDLVYQLALTLVPNIGDVHAKILIQHLGDAKSVFTAKQNILEKIEGIGTVRARSIKEFDAFKTAEDEIKFIEKYKIKTLFITDPDYPKRLLNCYDSPTILFYKGAADLNASRILAIVGTRTNTEYGKQFTEKLVKDLEDQNIIIISGLAFGIDAIAHKSALKNNIPTVGVVGHGLDKMYPYEHTGMAKEIMKQGGGILSEFFSGTKPDKHHFPLRNRIVAGLSDATVLVETHVKGGSMITAKLADAYNRDVFAVPGRTNDKASSGCNHLIKHNKAIMLTDSDELLDVMGWKEKRKNASKKQRELFIELSAEEKLVLQLLQEKEKVHIDEINLNSGLNSSAVAAAILNLELQNIIASLPGKMYRLL
ncbi:MAG: DNA-processing protein DprA [Flavisolibacter sp.]